MSSTRNQERPMLHGCHGQWQVARASSTLIYESIRMVSASLFTWSWSCVSVLLILPSAKETLGWLIQPGLSVQTRPSPSTPSFEVQSGASSHRPRGHRHPHPPPRALIIGARSGTRGPIGRVLSGDGGEGVTSGEGGEGAGNPAGAESGAGGRDQLQSAEDSDAPIFYIKGLQDGGGVGVWGEGSGGEAGASGKRQGKGNADRVAQAIRNVELGQENRDDQDVVEGEEGELEMPVWDKVQMSLGLGKWSYAGLGLALFIIFLNNWLGVGWLTRALTPDFDTEGLVDIEGRGQQIQIMPMDDPSNLL